MHFFIFGFSLSRFSDCFERAGMDSNQAFAAKLNNQVIKPKEPQSCGEGGCSQSKRSHVHSQLFPNAFSPSSGITSYGKSENLIV